MANQEQVTTFRIKDFWTDSMKRIIAVQDRFEAKVKGIQTTAGTSFDNLKNKFERFKVANIGAISDITSQIPGIGAITPMLVNPYVAGTAAVLGFATAAVDATKYAQQWEGKLAEANVTAKLSKAELKGVSDQLLDIGGNNVKNLMEVPETFNNILSAGLDVNETMKALQPTLRAAKAGFADTATTATAGVGVMNASGESINRVYDVLFATVDKGAASFKDIAQYLPKIIPGARNAGLALDETAGAWAYLTAQGMTSERATTLMENFTKVLSNPDRIAAFNKLGVAIFDQKGKILPITTIIDQLSKKMDGLSDKDRIKKLSTLGMDQEAAGAFASMTQNVDKLKETIDGTINSSGAADQAYKDAAQSGDTWAIVSNKMRVIWEKFGEKFLPFVEKAGQWVLDVIGYFERLNKESIIWNDYLVLWGTYFNILYKAAKIPLEYIWNQLKNIFNVVSWIGDKLGATGNGFEEMYFKARPHLIWIKETLSSILDIAYKVMTADISGAWKSISEFKLPDMADIIAKQNSEVAKRTFDKIADVGLPGSKSLNPVKNKEPFAGLDLGSGSTDKGSGKKSGAVSGGGGTKTITINIQQLLPGMTVNATTIKEAAGDLGRLIQEELVKMISDTTLAIE